MASVIEGTWNNFTFKFIEPEDIPRIYDHFRNNFLLDERLSELSGYTEEYAQDFEKLYDCVFCMGHRLSFIATDNSNGKIAGVRITFIQTKYTSFAHLKFKTPQMHTMMKVIGTCNEKGDILGRYPIDHFANYITASIGREYRNVGLASEMYRRSEALLRERKLPLVASVFTSPWTRKIATNRKFVELSRVYFKDLNDENESAVLPHAKDDDFAALMVLELS